jgi:uncharacterized damage-inducible protein DinB
MSLVAALLPEYDHEMATTRRLLQRVPEIDFSWRPHERSMTLGELSGHLSDIPTWCSSVLDETSLDLEALGDQLKAKSPASGAALLGDFDRRVSVARASLARSTDAELLAPWTLKSGTQELFTFPRISAIRTFVMNHLIHHRGQLSVYLRLRDVPLPAIYGPTADER